MLFAREAVFGIRDDWCLHIRTDGSPQFGRNYQVTQLDKVTAASSAESVQIVTYLCSALHYVSKFPMSSPPRCRWTVNTWTT